MRYRSVVLVVLMLIAACGDAGTPDEASPTAPDAAADTDPALPFVASTSAGTATTGEAGGTLPPASPPSTPAPAPRDLTPVDGGAVVSPTPPASGAVARGLEPLAAKAVADLAGRLSIPVDEVEVVSADPVVWPDGSLGCPQPGMRYLQVQVEGARIVLGAAGTMYAYHAGGGRGPFLCESPGKP